MSATALFEFDINLDKISSEELLIRINEIVGTESSIGTNVDLVSKEELKSRTDSEFPQELSFLKDISDQFVNEIEEKLAPIFDDNNSDGQTVEYTHKTSSKKWELILGYYIDDDEYDLYREVVRLLLEISVGEVFYFREPEAQGNDDYEDAIEISINDLKDYTPDMSDFKTYVFKKQ